VSACVSLIGFAATRWLIPRVASKTLARGICGKDLNKKVSRAGRGSWVQLHAGAEQSGPAGALQLCAASRPPPLGARARPPPHAAPPATAPPPKQPPPPTFTRRARRQGRCPSLSRLAWRRPACSYAA
jgi:hypothetical protein